MNTKNKLRILNSAAVYAILWYAIYTEGDGEFHRPYCLLAIVTGFLGRRLTNCLIEAEGIGLKLDEITAKGTKTEELRRHIENDSGITSMEVIMSYGLTLYAAYKLFI